ncbi:hypothetical protein GH714_019568 [Hevea brasiliensis]|uniref:mitogen-activated protein kinase kinase kinase n=1 Tax=Hevea brasiliensis TaxID=3981 RepID=A0A6A6K5T0_HEVBR|nr:hypothetical protein GH714_019568 [Hevea brasiliensis]
MQDLFGSVRRSLVFKSTTGEDGGFSGLVEKIGSSIRNSRIGLFSKPPLLPALRPCKKDDTPPIRWRKGELIGCGAFGRVYMGMNLDSGELLAVKQVIRMYAKQLLVGLEYLHKNGIMHRDIKGCIKLADFGASKKVVELATINGAKSMKGTPYWMAPEVILQTGHSFSADIWSVGCTVIEMATGKPPWSQQYQEVAALFHIGTTKSHPPIPDHLSVEAKDFLLRCLQKEPNLRPTASDLLQHPFVIGEYKEPHLIFRNSVMVRSTCAGLKDVCEMGSIRSSTVYPQNMPGSGSYWAEANFDDDMCQIDDKDDFVIDDKDDFAVSASARFNSAFASADLSKSFNPMSEPIDGWPCKFDESPESNRGGINFSSNQSIHDIAVSPVESGKTENDFTFPCGPVATEDDDEVTESKIRAFLDEKALDLKKLQTPLYEEFYNTLNAVGLPSTVGTANNENIANLPNLTPKSKSPRQLPRRRLSAVDATNSASPGRANNKVSVGSSIHKRALQEIQQEIQQPQVNEWKDLLLDSQQETITPSARFSERQRKWKEELDEELERKREMMRQAGIGGKTSSPKDRILTQQRDRLRFVFPGK